MVFIRVDLTPLARTDITSIKDVDVRAAAVAAMVEIERDLEFGRLLEVKDYTGDLRGCRKVYADRNDWEDKPRYRLVYWCSLTSECPARRASWPSGREHRQPSTRLRSRGITVIEAQPGSRQSRLSATKSLACSASGAA